jgi:hypothetical protein
MTTRIPESVPTTWTIVTINAMPPRDPNDEEDDEDEDEDEDEESDDEPARRIARLLQKFGETFGKQRENRRSLVGVAGFEPATPSSRTRCIAIRPLKYRRFS